MLTPTDVVASEPNRWRKIYQEFWPRFWVALKNCRADSKYRSLILRYYGFFWLAGWTLWMLFVSLLPMLRLPFTILGILFVGGAISLVWLHLGPGKTGLWAVLTALVLFVIFITVVSILSSIITYQLGLWALGTLLIYLLGAITFFVPFWHIDIKYGEIFLIEDTTVAGPEKFQLVVRLRPFVDPLLVDRIIQAGASAERIYKFLDYGGPQFMQDELISSVAPDNRVALHQLFDQVSDPGRQPDSTLKANSLKKMRLVWTRGDSIEVNLGIVDDIITQEGKYLSVELTFSCYFDPFDIREPAFRLRLANWESIDAMKKWYQEVLSLRAKDIIRQYFVTIPLRSALTDGSIKKFRYELVDNMAWAKDVFGISLRRENIRCHPIAPELVRQEQVNTMKSHFRTQTEATKSLPHIFISYRRADSQAVTGRIYDRLVAAFGKENIFKDVDSIPLGSSFAKVLETELNKSNVLLVVIGRKWVNIKNKANERRLDDPKDFVRLEVETGLQRSDILIIPVLVNGVSVPNQSDLPDSLRNLISLQIATIRHDPDFHKDMDRLIDFLKNQRFSN